MDSNIKPGRSVATPIMTDLQVKLVKQLDEDEPYCVLMATIEQMAQDLRKQTGVRPREIIKEVEGDAEHKEMQLLLHTIPRPILRSIAMGLVAYDFWERGSERRKNWLYTFDGPGTYLATLSIEYRQGCTWNGHENLRIVATLRGYAKAVEAYQRVNKDDAYGNSQYTDEEISDLKTAMKIDGQFLKGGHADADETGDSQSFGDKAKNIYLLVDLLNKRTADPRWSLDERCIQSLAMVGNSDDVQRRTQSHRLISDLRSTPHLWGLLVSTLRYLKMEPVETVLPICKAWKVEHINMAEILVTILAGSLISVRGLNVAQPGTKMEKNPPSKRTLEECRKEVYLGHPWFNENLEATVAHTAEERAMLRDRDGKLGLTQEDFDELWKLADEEQDLANQVTDKALEFEKALDAKKKKIAETEATLAEIKAKTDAREAYIAKLAFEDFEPRGRDEPST
ncbi:hypothetical protein F4780DRAFT_792495 [Xylariomycetidae sp. FL0641]|nr:hypothetical protein F4780DRAFT_792495 [Xylariomycetidae sp. FL0641]